MNLTGSCSLKLTGTTFGLRLATAARRCGTASIAYTLEAPLSSAHWTHES